MGVNFTTFVVGFLLIVKLAPLHCITILTCSLSLFFHQKYRELLDERIKELREEEAAKKLENDKES